MSFNLKNMPKYQITPTVYCTSGLRDGSKTAEVQKFNSEVTILIEKLDDPTKIAECIIKYYNKTLRGEKKFELEGLGVISDTEIRIDIVNKHKNATFFTNISSLSVNVKQIKK